MPAELFPISAIIPTRNRASVLRRTLESLAIQSVQPAQLVLVDASDSAKSRGQCFEWRISSLASELTWLAASSIGAAVQRNQAMQECKHEVIGFLDDDILFEPDCIARLWAALQSENSLGGVSAMITNQRYRSPGFVSRMLFSVLDGQVSASYAGRVLGPAVNLLPEDHEDLPDILPMEWLNTTCTLYRRDALPNPLFSENFIGYSLMEDLALSLIVGKRWKLANARRARIYHDSQPGAHKDDVVTVSRMEMVNRHHVMTQVLQRRRIRDYAKLALWECFQLAAHAIQNRGGREFWQMLRGKILGTRDLFGAPATGQLADGA